MSPACRRPLNSLFEEDLQVRAESTDSNRLKNVEITGRWRSGQSQQTVNLPPNGLRRFEPSPPHQPYLTRDACRRLASRRRLVGRASPPVFPWPPRLRAAAFAAESETHGEGWRRAEVALTRGGCWGELAADSRMDTRRLALSERSESKGGSNSVVESQPSKLLVAGSIPVSRSSLRSPMARNGELRLATHGRSRMHVAADLSAEARPVRRSAKRAGERAKADVAQLAERVLGKDEVTSSILVIGSSLRSRASRASFGEASQFAQAS